MKYKFLEHTADIKVMAEGVTKDEAFQNAALGLTALMVNPELIVSRITRKIEVEAEDTESLLFDFLSEILYLFDIQGTIFNRYDIKIENNKLTCRASGEIYDSTRHEPRSEVKAITYHDMSIKQKERKWVITFIPDL
jgi:SHS2 domain-containing protein